MTRRSGAVRNGLRYLVLGAGLLVASPGCKLVQRALQGDSDVVAVNSASPDGSGAEEEADYEVSEKISAHIDCLNYASRDAYNARRSYLRYIDEKAGPTGKENGVWVNKVDATRCATGLAKAKTLKPDLPDLNQVSDVYLAALQKLAPVVKQASDYYDQKDYKDDAWAKGKQMHAGLMAAFDEFDKAHQAFEAKVKGINAGLTDRRLQRLKQDPAAKLEYLAAKVVQDAKPLVGFLEISEIKELNEPGYKKALDTFEASATEYDTYVEAHPDEASKVIAMSIFKSQVTTFLKTAKELLRNKRDGKELDTMSPETTTGHPANVIKEFNDLISRSNGMTFRR